MYEFHSQVQDPVHVNSVLFLSTVMQKIVCDVRCTENATISESVTVCVCVCVCVWVCVFVFVCMCLLALLLKCLCKCEEVSEQR